MIILLRGHPFILTILELHFTNARMIERRIAADLNELLDSMPAVALIGTRQVGKTTLALTIGERRPSIYLDLESDADRARLAEPELYLAAHQDKLVILDEVHRLPGLFQNLRGLIDRGGGLAIDGHRQGHSETAVTKYTNSATSLGPRPGAADSE
jgi:uncharacterized protein